MVNKVILVGNLGQDIVTHVFEGGGKLAKTSMATKETWKDKQTGERKSNTTWHNLVFNGPLADLAEKYLSKGSKLYIEGKIASRTWEKDGVKHYSTDIVVRELTFLDSKPQGQVQENQAQGQAPGAQDPGGSEPDDLPF